MNKIRLTLILIVSLILSGCGDKSGSGTKKMIKMNWSVGFSDTRDDNPGEYFNALVPGSALLDYINAKNDPPLYYDDNFKKYES